MEKKKACLLLKATFLIGALTDALALVPMLCPAFAKSIWGLDVLSGSYFFAMGYGASLMFGWTLLLIWAYQKPLERRSVSLFSSFVVAGLVATEIVSTAYGIIEVGKILTTIALQSFLLSLFILSLMESRQYEAKKLADR